MPVVNNPQQFGRCTGDGLRDCRLAEAFNLIAIGCGALTLGFFQMSIGINGDLYPLLGFSVPLTYSLLWVAIRLSGSLATRGAAGRIGYGCIAVVSLIATPFGLLAATSTSGSLTILGLGFVLLGWRAGLAKVWAIAGFGMLIGFLSDSTLFRNVWTNWRYQESMPGVVTTAFGSAVIAAAIWVIFIEDRTEMDV